MLFLKIFKRELLRSLSLTRGRVYKYLLKYCIFVYILDKYIKGIEVYNYIKVINFSKIEYLYSDSSNDVYLINNKYLLSYNDIYEDKTILEDIENGKKCDLIKVKWLGFEKEKKYNEIIDNVNSFLPKKKNFINTGWLHILGTSTKPTPTIGELNELRIKRLRKIYKLNSIINEKC